MRALLRGVLCVPMAFCIPAWGSGFCDGGHLPLGGSDCRQSDAAYTWGAGGAVVADYRDLDPSSILQASDALEFGLSLPVLSGYASIRVVVFELTVSDSSGQTRTLAIAVSRDSGKLVLEANWLDTNSYWSSADWSLAPLPSGEVVGLPLPIGATYAQVRIVPQGGWGSVAVYFNGNRICAFEMPSGLGTTSTLPVRIRSGVISANPLRAGMSVSFDYVFPER